MRATCIKCWDAAAVVKLHLDGSGDFECDTCNETFTCEAVKETLAAMQKGWARLIKWADAYPKEDASN